jgi:hypothetical protein
MGHIHLSIKHNNEIKPYIIVDAEYLHEAWIAEAYDDNTTKIIKQFRYKEFKNCFPEIINCVDHLGEVVNLTGTDIEERSVNRLRNILRHKAFYVHKSNYDRTVEWLQHILIAPIMDYKLLSL